MSILLNFLLTLAFPPITSDRIKYCGLLIFIPTTWNVIGYACIRSMAVSSTKWHKYAVFASASASYANMQYSSSRNIYEFPFPANIITQYTERLLAFCQL